MATEVILADDHEIVRVGIKSALAKQDRTIEVVGEASNGCEVLELARVYPGCIYVLDISMPLLNGLQTAERLLKLDPKNKVIILSMHDDNLLVEKALKAGAKGYLLKTNASQEIVQAIHEVSQGRFFLSSKISGFVVKGFLGKGGAKQGGDDKREQLSAREKEVLQLIAEGMSNKEIAAKLEISSNTVHVHRNSIMGKLNIHSTAELTRYALKEKISQL